jgi:hypothetical protein
MRISTDALLPDFAKSFRRDDPSRRSSLFALAALTVIGCLYYASYYNYYFNWADEGSVALIAERLSKGERPYVDIEIGYGVLWFYPIAFLFKAFGANFLVARIWFICLGFAAALFAYALCWRLTQNRVVAFSVALLVLLFPGSGYKTYIPLLVIAGAYVLFLYDVRTLKPTTAPWLAIASNGAYLSIAFLIRGDIATVYSALFLLYHGLTGLQTAIRERDPRRLLLFPTRLAGVLLVAAIVALPFTIHAKANGYLEGYLHQYSYYAQLLIAKTQTRYLEPSGAAAVQDAEAAGTLLPRASMRSFFWPGHTLWAFLTYAPLLPLFFVLFYLCLDLFKRRFSAPGVADFLSDNAYLIILSIGAFSAFPQFFVFRPDIAHLSEFMPGFVVLCGYFLFLVRTQLGDPKAFAAARRWGSYIFGVLCIVYLVAYAAHYSDGIYFRRDRPNRLQIEDRLDVYVNRYEYKVLDGLNTMIRKASGPDDYVLCFPYCPGINFVTGRPTFQKFLYVDDSFLISRPNWLAEMREEIAAKKPKVIVIWNWDINRTRISRFSVWAAPLYRFIGDTYELRARIAQNDKDQSWYEVYVLK